MATNDNEPKWIGRSKTAWGALMMAVPTAIAFGAALGWWGPNVLGDAELVQINDFGLSAIGFLGLLLTMFGRKKATQPVTFIPTLKKKAA